MKTQEFQAFLQQLFSVAPTHATVALGPPGVGKTAIITAEAERIGLPIITLALPTCEAVDLRGLPYNKEGSTRWASPLPKEGKGVLLLDELSSAPLDVQVAAHHVLWREVGSDMTLGPDWHVIATGNRASDRAVTKPLTAPLRSRITQIEVQPDLHGWLRWAQDHGVNPWIRGFLKWRPELASEANIPAEGPFPTYRGWTMVNQMLNYAVSSDIEHELISGTVGVAAATEFANFLRLARELPSCEQLMVEPKKAPMPNAASTAYAITMALADWSRREKKSAMSYLQRFEKETSFGPEYVMVWLRECANEPDLDLKRDPVTLKWLEQHKTTFQNATKV